MTRPPRSKVAAGMFSMRLTDEEKARYASAARKAGLSLSAWIRKQLDRASKR